MIDRAGDVASIICSASDIHIVTHIDADGIAAGAIASATLQRLGTHYSIECVKQLDEQLLQHSQYIISYAQKSNHGSP